MKMVEYQSVNRNPIVLLQRLRGPEDIAYSPDGVYHFFLEFPVDLVSQSANQDVHYICLWIETVIPDVLQDHSLGKNPPRVAHQGIRAKQIHEVASLIPGLHGRHLLKGDRDEGLPLPSGLAAQEGWIYG